MQLRLRASCCAGAQLWIGDEAGLSRAAFVRDKLDPIGVGPDLEELIDGGYRYDLRGLGPAHPADKAAVPWQTTELNQPE
jgi:hypothetical protein